MIKVIIVSGFLGAGKTTLIKKILNNQKSLGRVMLLENEFGEIGIDGSLLKNSIEVKEINNGCICCSLEGKLDQALDELAKYEIDTLIVEPSGVAKLSEIIKSFKENDNFEISSSIAVVDVTKSKMYHKNFREFYDDQISFADIVCLSRTDIANYDTVKESVHLIEGLNEDAIVITTALSQLKDDFLFDLILNKEDDECDCGCECHHHHEHDEENCMCHHHDHEEETCCQNDEKDCGCHDHHDHKDQKCDHHHHHHYDENGVCECGHHHDAKDTFNSFGFKTIKVYEEKELLEILKSLDENVVRAKGIVNGKNGWLHFEYTPNEPYIYKGEANYTGLISVIGTNLNKETLMEKFKLND